MNLDALFPLVFTATEIVLGKRLLSTRAIFISVAFFFCTRGLLITVLSSLQIFSPSQDSPSMDNVLSGEQVLSPKWEGTASLRNV